MICCKGGRNDPESKLDRDINGELRREQREKTKTRSIKLLLLGAGDSGKSTIAKQMKILYLNGYSEEERKNIVPAIHANVLSSIKDILKGVQRFNLTLSDDIKDVAAEVSALQSHAPWNRDLVAKLKLLCSNSEVLKVLKKSSEMQLYDHLEYMLAKLDVYAAPDYIPTVEDILKVRVRTTGILEITYQIERLQITVMDMGGQRSERRKWIFFFEGVTAVIFVLALNEFDLRLREDPNVNRMHESLDLFKKVINNQYFKDTAIIFFMNKTDLFADKIRRSDLKVCFPDYAGGPSYEAGLEYITTKFTSFNMNPKRNIFAHATCATDTDNLRKVLEDVRLTLLQNVLTEIGLL